MKRRGQRAARHIGREEEALSKSNGGKMLYKGGKFLAQRQMMTVLM